MQLYSKIVDFYGTKLLRRKKFLAEKEPPYPIKLGNLNLKILKINFWKNLQRTCKERDRHFNRLKFSENSNNFHELVRLDRSMSYPARLDGSQCHNYIFRHCKRLVLRLILAHSIKSTLTRFKTLKMSNTRLMGVYHKIIEYFY